MFEQEVFYNKGGETLKLHREQVDVPSLEAFNVKFCGALSNMI